MTFGDRTLELTCWPDLTPLTPNANHQNDLE